MYKQQPWMQFQPAPTTQESPALPYQVPPQQPAWPGAAMQPGFPPGFPSGFPQPFPTPQQPGMLPLEQSYIENILRLNRGKVGTFYMTYENNQEWNAKIFRGVVEEAGRDHIIISDPQSGTYYLLLMLNLDYVTFEEPLEYEYPFGVPAPMAQYSPR
ncbi:spore coat protein GerQ [Anaerobacillus alkalidiazotrophicus]|uniref:Spore coat protein GerQ n=1 Tax=Anaerobacillus alkalidiazotrophicus TaxID=472963 RepID=A0A1S2MAT0_9BACI|nr:spore coat protein GerQ [Anaerobacillus alkalidiazotrophicus]OIJ21831.1 spore coat protein GerQ [Anaerobacillus alkalidiazotrophicus]